MGYGVSACATCDGFFFKDKDALVVGGGDTAMEEATFLTKFCTKVTDRASARPAARLQDHAGSGPQKSQDRVYLGSALSMKFTDSPTRQACTGATDRECQDRASQRRSRPTQCSWRSGIKPNTDLFTGQLEMDELGYLMVKPGSTYTNVEGVFAAGDVADRVYRQAVTAAGTGCMAAIDAERWLEARHS